MDKRFHLMAYISNCAKWHSKWPKIDSPYSYQPGCEKSDCCPTATAHAMEGVKKVRFMNFL
jgi:hypothetical protein